MRVIYLALVPVLLGLNTCKQTDIPALDREALVAMATRRGRSHRAISWDQNPASSACSDPTPADSAPARQKN